MTQNNVEMNDTTTSIFYIQTEFYRVFVSILGFNEILYVFCKAVLVFNYWKN